MKHDHVMPTGSEQADRVDDLLGTLVQVGYDNDDALTAE